MPPADRSRHAATARRLARRRWGRGGVLVLVTLLAASVIAGYARRFARGGDDWSAFERQTFHVIEVPDGNTLVIRPPSGGRETRVHLVGIAAPAPGEHWAAESRQHLASRTEGKAVDLRLEPTQSRTADGDLLAHAYVDEDELNLALLREGHAYADRRSIHSMRKQFDQAEYEARQRRRGLWKSVREEQMPTWRQEWLRARREEKRERLGRPATRGT